MIKAVIFDMDGLMFDSERLVCENWTYLLKERGMEFSLDFFKTLLGLRIEDSEKRFKEKYGEDFDYQGFRAIARKRYFELVSAEGVPIKQGLIELLEYLRKSKIKTAVATSTSEVSASRSLEIAGVTKYFDAFIFGDNVTNGKPHPEIYLTAAEKLGVKPQECVALEDSFNGIRSAYNAGMTAIMIPDMLLPDDEIRKKASYVLNDLSEVISIIKKLNN